MNPLITLPGDHIPFGYNFQADALTLKWAINPDWLTELGRLNSGMSNIQRMEDRSKIRAAVAMQIASMDPERSSDRAAVLCDWDDYFQQCTDRADRPILKFVHADTSFRLDDWSAEPDFMNVEQTHTSFGYWAINPAWLDWAIDEVNYEKLLLATNAIGCTGKRVAITALLNKALAANQQMHVNDVITVIDWEEWSVQSNQKEWPILFFMTSVSL